MRAILALFIALAPTAVLAHTGTGDAHAHDLVHGFMHPIGGLDHILAMVAVGVFAFVLGGRAMLLVPLAFVAMMAVGFGLGIAGMDLPFVELGIALSSIVIGGAAALGRPMPVAAAMSLVGVFAIFHGHAHGAEMPAGSSGLGYALGFIAATALLHAAGIGAATGVSALAARYGRPLARIAGGLFAVAGAGVLAGWL
ncbi:HupE/UreJ family protein [Devosia sp.]|uniref:HupE/UreJ family protein n=1 Tax=Devosia sp. TaxID=1871048 RepID=UPI003A902E92